MSERHLRLYCADILDSGSAISDFACLLRVFVMIERHIQPLSGNLRLSVKRWASYPSRIEKDVQM